jgi:hypothetical protein
MSRFILLLPAVLTLCQHGCAVFSGQLASDSIEPQSYEVEDEYQRAVKHDVHELPAQGQQMAEIVMLTTSNSRSAISVGVRPNVETNTDLFSQSIMPTTLKPNGHPTSRSVTIPRSTPAAAGHWLAIEKALWNTAYRQGKVHHESVGNGYAEDTDNEMSQHAIRQTVRIDMGSDVQCLARRKFYLEVVSHANRLVDRYVASFRRRNGLRGKAPFGVDTPRIRDQLYFQQSELGAAQQRIELHRGYVVLNSTPGELVETALICQGPNLSTDKLGSFTARWADASRRLAIQFTPLIRPRVQALDQRQRHSKEIDALPVARQ